MINEKSLKLNGFGSFRIINTFTPNSFCEAIIVISTMCRTSGRGQTAIAKVNALNHMSIDFQNLDYEILKEHDSIKEALEFHTEQVNEVLGTKAKEVKDE